MARTRNAPEPAQQRKIKSEALADSKGGILGLEPSNSSDKKIKSERSRTKVKKEESSSTPSSPLSPQSDIKSELPKNEPNGDDTTRSVRTSLRNGRASRRAPSVAKKEETPESESNDEIKNPSIRIKSRSGARSKKTSAKKEESSPAPPDVKVDEDSPVANGTSGIRSSRSTPRKLKKEQSESSNTKQEGEFSVKIKPEEHDESQDDISSSRAANIARNRALLSSLGVNSASAALSARAPPKTETSQKRKRKSAVSKPAVKKEEPGPRRTSSRLLGLTADSEVAKRKAEEEENAIAEEARRKRQRVEGDLKLEDIGVKDGTRSGPLVDLVNRGAKPGERTFTAQDVQGTKDKNLKSLREQISSLKIYEDWDVNDIKITPERIYAMGFHPTPTKPLLFAGDKMGHLGIFDASQTRPAVEDDDEEDEVAIPEITQYHIHTRTISAIAFTAETLYTASYDSTVRALPLSSSTSTTIFSPGLDNPDSDAPISCLSLPSDNHLYASTLDGTFISHDIRTAPHSSGTSTFALSEKKIGGFSHNPAATHLVATASLDRTLRVWDLRYVSGRSTARMPQLVGEHESRLSVSHASFNSNGQIATSSYDDTIKIHKCPLNAGASSDTEPDPLKPESIISHNNQTGRWVTILRALWQKEPSDGYQKFVIGNMNRFVDVYDGQGEQLGQLGGGADGITAVPAVAVWHPTENWIGAGTASGKLCYWS